MARIGIAMSAADSGGIASLGRRWLTMIGRSQYMRHVAALISGTVVAQLIPIAASPILTRVYRPSDFGVLAVFTAIIGVLSVPVTGRYEIAILLPGKDRDAGLLTVLVAVITAGFSLFTLAVAVGVASLWPDLLSRYGVTGWIFWLPICLVFLGWYQALYYWNNRRRRYRQMALSRVVQAIVLVIVTIAIGCIWSGPAGLIIGFVLGQIAALIALALLTERPDWRQFAKPTLVSVGAMAHRYRDFSRFSVPAALANVTANQLPVVLITGFFGAAAAGFYALTQRVLGAPSALVGRAFADVFRQRATDDFRDRGNCRTVFRRTFWLLIGLGVVPFTVLLVAAVPLFEFVFGAEWRSAGRFAQILAPMFLVRFVANPLSGMFYVAEKQRYDFVWQTSLLVVTLASLTVGCVRGSTTLALGLFSAGYCLMYFISLSLAYRFATGASAAAAVATDSGKENL